ncbi:MAG: hypothetical protein K6F86_05930 [Lachnospiraceae bacterium]|nr:hypothetical protein [Lachnospiraceae bacterium]
MSDLYRKTSLDRLSSPEQLDKMIKITPPMFWIGAAGGAFIFIMVLLWLVTARLPIIVQSSGIFISKNEDKVICYVPISYGKKIEKGMDVMIYPTTVNVQKCGNISGKVIEVDDYVTSWEDMEKQLGNDSLVQLFAEDGPVVTVTCEPDKDPNSASGYRWTGGGGASVTIAPGTMADVDIVIEKKAPISLLIPLAKDKISVHEREQFE